MHVKNDVCYVRGFNLDAGVVILNKSNEKGQETRSQLEIDFL